MTPQLLKLIAENKSLKDKIDQYRQTTGLLPYIDDFVIKGGYHVVKNIAERDSIDCCHRKLGMKVLVVGSDLSFKEYILKTDNCKKNIWEEVDVTIEENEVFLIEDYSELSENLTTQKELNLILKQLILNLQTQIDNIEHIDEKVQITENTPFAQIGQTQKDFNKNIADEVISLTDFIEVTKTELDVLISENNLEPNRLYKITGVESWCFSQHLIKAIYLKAITNNTLEIEGVGEFYTPKYNTSDSNLGIWKGELLANGMILSASYNIGDKVIWGNLFWENISGNIGTNEKESMTLGTIRVDNYLSEEDWQLITPNDDVSLYNIQFNSIKYDVGNDYINYRADDLGNVYEINYNTLLTYDLSQGDDPSLIYYLNAISLFQWGRSSTYKNIIKDSLVSNCNYNTTRFYNNTVEDTRIAENNFLNVDIIGNYFKSASVDKNYLKHFGGILENNLDNSAISLNRYYFQISHNTLKNYSNILNNNDNNIIVNGRYTSITSNNLDNNSFISSNTFVEEGKGVSGYVKGINGNKIINNSSINNNTIKNGSRIIDHNLSYFSTINGNTLDTDSNIYNNQVIQGSKINNNILTGHGRIYGNQLDRVSEITLCKLRIYPATSYATTMKSNRLFAGKIQNVDFGNIVNPVGSDPNNPAFGGNALSECIIENESIIKDLTFPNNGGIGIQFVKMNGYSEFKNITVNNPIRNVDFINTIFNETSDYSKLIEGSGYQTNGFTKTYIDGVLLQDKLDEKQNVLTNPITGTGSTNSLVKFLPDGTVGNSSIFDSGTNVGIGLIPISERLEIDGKILAGGFKKGGGTPTQALTANGGTFDLDTKADLVGGKVLSSQLPSYVDDVLEFANLASFPATGESGKIYIAIDTNVTYRWSGTGYSEISASLALGETASTAYRGDRGKIAYDHSQVTHDKNLVGLGNVDNTSDLNKPISTATQNALNTKADLAVVDNLQIGGRNLILNSDSNNTILLYGVTATYENIVDNQLPSKQYFKFTNVVRTVENYVFYIPTNNNPDKFSQSLTGKKIQISFHIRSNNSQKLVFDRDGNQNFMIDNTWQKVRFNTVFNGGNLHFFLEGSGLTSFDISSVKLEFGDKATDWTPAPEDKQDRLQNVIGNIGIGKTDASATEKLDVNGNVKASGFKKDNGTANQALTADGGVFDLNLKLSTEAPSTTGTVISFSTDKVYGTLTTPETGNITANVTNAKLGVTNIIIHNSGTAPTFGSQFKKLSGSGNYVTGVVNYIYCTYISATEIIYSINQRT